MKQSQPGPSSGERKRSPAMKLSMLTLLLIGSSLLIEAQTNPQDPQAAAMQQPAPNQQPQQGAPSGQPAAMPPQQPAAAGAPAGASNVASALHVYAYPKGNQPPDKQPNDETECYQSAQTANQPAPGQGQPADQQGQPSGQSSKAGNGATVKGSAGGAATGAAVGAIAGDAGQGAAIGAVGGAAVGHRRKKKAKEEAQKQQEQQQQQQQAQATDNVKRAYTACMEARNYVVK